METDPFSETAGLFRKLNHLQSPEIRLSKRASVFRFISERNIYSWFEVALVQVNAESL